MKHRKGDPWWNSTIAFDHTWIVWILNQWMIQNGMSNISTRVTLVRDYILSDQIAFFKVDQFDEVVLRISPSKFDLPDYWLKWMHAKETC